MSASNLPVRAASLNHEVSESPQAASLVHSASPHVASPVNEQVMLRSFTHAEGGCMYQLKRPWDVRGMYCNHPVIEGTNLCKVHRHIPADRIGVDGLVRIPVQSTAAVAPIQALVPTATLGIKSFVRAENGCMCQMKRPEIQRGMYCNRKVVPGTDYCKSHSFLNPDNAASESSVPFDLVPFNHQLMDMETSMKRLTSQFIRHVRHMENRGMSNPERIASLEATLNEISHAITRLDTEH